MDVVAQLVGNHAGVDAFQGTRADHHQAHIVDALPDLGERAEHERQAVAWIEPAEEEQRPLLAAEARQPRHPRIEHLRVDAIGDHPRVELEVARQRAQHARRDDGHTVEPVHELFLKNTFEGGIYQRRLEVAVKRADARAVAEQRRQRREREEQRRVQLQQVEALGLQHLAQVTPEVRANGEVRDRPVAINLHAASDPPGRDAVGHRQVKPVRRRRGADDGNGVPP